MSSQDGIQTSLHNDLESSQQHFDQGFPAYKVVSFGVCLIPFFSCSLERFSGTLLHFDHFG